MAKKIEKKSEQVSANTVELNEVTVSVKNASGDYEFKIKIAKSAPVVPQVEAYFREHCIGGRIVGIR